MPNADGRGDLVTRQSAVRKHVPHAEAAPTESLVSAVLDHSMRRGHAMTALECPELRGMRVLVVDDDADNRDLIATVLQNNGAVVATAESAAEALEAFERERPHVLISDIGLPDDDGFCLLRKLRALPASQGGDVPAIALTGYGSAESSKQVNGEGFQAHLTKPVALSDMLATIARVLRSRPTLPGR